MSFPAGQTLTDQVTFKNADGALYDPTTVVVEVRNPNGTLSYPIVTKISVGVYRANIPLNRGFTRWIWDGITASIHDKVEGCACAAQSVTAA